MTELSNQIEEIIKQCIIPNDENSENRSASQYFIQRRKEKNYNEKLGVEKFLHLYESLNTSQQQKLITEVAYWAALDASDSKRTTFLKIISKPIFLHCLKDQ